MNETKAATSAIQVNLTLDDLKKIKNQYLTKEMGPNAFVISYPMREILERGIPVHAETKSNFLGVHPNTFMGIKLLPCIFLKKDESFGCKTDEDARDLIGFINFCEKFDIDWREHLKPSNP